MEERSTRQKRAIQEVLKGAAAPLTPQEIADLAKAHTDAMSVSTVYRQLARLQEKELVTVVRLPGQPPRYEEPRGHHHHFVCRMCGSILELQGCKSSFAGLAPQGCEVEDHELTLIGRCAKCLPA